MTPLQFEERYGEDWQRLEELLTTLRTGSRAEASQVSGADFAALYRRVSEHLALARARAYPAHLTDRLDRITLDAHQVVYQRREFGLSRLWALIAHEIPRAVRAHATYVWISAAVFVIPAIVVGLLVYFRPALILSVVDPATAAQYEAMYSPAAESIGRARDVHTDWAMFGFYIRNNIGIAFQVFASGIFVAVGSLFFIAMNGVMMGAIAGFLTERGLSETFYSFVVTHAAFELTAIVLAGGAGLRVGHSLLSPGRLTRTQALVVAARQSVIIMYGALGMLLIAAAVEAFWSSQTWIPPLMKYSVAAVCWIAVLSYLTLQGRRAG